MAREHWENDDVPEENPQPITAMPIKDTIFSSPVNIPTLLTKQGAAECVDSLFINFMHYAKKNWSYIASSKAGGEALLDGTATQVPCGGIATALKILIEEKLHLLVDYITSPGYVWTKSSFPSFDFKVHGNVSRAETPTLFNEGCFFNQHYFIKCGTKYYDPCLNSTYATENEPVRKRYASQEIISKGSIMPGENADSLLVFQPDVIVPGWQRGAWQIANARTVLNQVRDKFTLLAISTRLKTGELALTARKASRAMFEKEGKLSAWISEHKIKGIIVS